MARYWLFAFFVGLGFAMSGGFGCLLRWGGRRTPPRRWEWLFALVFGPVLFTGIAALVILDRPAWVPAPPGSMWLVQVMFYLAAATSAFAGWFAWRTTRRRWEAAAMGEPALAADPLGDLSLRQLTGDSPRLRPAAEVPPSWRYHLMLFGTAGLMLLMAAPAFGGPGSAVLTRMSVFREFGPVFLVLGAAGGVMAVSRLVGDWWGVPVVRSFVTADGLLAPWLTVHWADAEAVTLAPAPGWGDGTELLEVIGPGTFGRRTVRLLVDPAAAPALRAILAGTGALIARAPDDTPTEAP